MRKIIYSIMSLAFLFISINSNAQVSTTATIQGLVVDSKGEALIGANVIAIHKPTGSFSGTTTRNDGRFTLPNLKVGGPYTIEASYIGSEKQSYDNIYLQLGQKLSLSFKLADKGVQLEGVTITGKSDPILNNERTGAETSITSEVITKLPTISRSTSDYYRLNPSADGSSFGGRNNKMNNFTLDGSIFNNPFGLDAATPGSQTNAQPVSLDAIEQIQVSLAPYDVTQAGFVGAAVNAVTKSGTNEFHGTAFGFFRNQDLTGAKVKGNDIFKADLQHLQTGVSLGGPIIKDKLFFFANAEIERRSDLATEWVAKREGLDGSNVSRVLASDLDKVSKALKDKYEYETGPYENFNHRTDNQKAMLKLDWHINQSHSFSLAYNFLDASRDKPAHPEAIGRRGPDFITLQFKNSGYAIRNKLHSFIGEFKSIIGNTYANNLQVGYTAFRDSRAPFSDPFPTINIAKDGIRYIVAGFEPFSIHNRLNQDVFQATDNFNIYLGKHTLTIGASFEKFQFDNSFNLNTYPGVFAPDFVSVDAFVDSVNTGAFDASVEAARNAAEILHGEDGEMGVDLDPNTKGYQGWALAETNVGQIAAYIQDEWSISDRFTLTAGLRVDKALYFDTPDKIQENIDRQCCYAPDIEWYYTDGTKATIDHTKLPDAKILFSPRIGFNFDVKGDKSTIIRGGTGSFTGRFPFVWVGNQVANPNWWFYCATAPDFQFPQVWRSNIGIDTKLPGDFTLSADVIYTKDINAMMVRNWGLNKPTGSLKGVDNRPIYTFGDKAVFNGLGFPLPVNGYVFTNTNVGQTFNAMFQIQKHWANGMFMSLAYSYLDSKDASSIPAEISSDAFARNPAYGDVNEPVLSYSRYGNKHRIVGSAYKKFSYSHDKMATSIAFFFEAAQGGRYSYTYSGDINGDGSRLNDLIYIPTKDDLNKMNFDETNSTAQEQRNALDLFIDQDDYLNSRRGKYAEKYASLNPWFTDVDMRILQDFNLMVGGKKNTIQLSLDVLNLGNLLNSNWGVRQYPSNTQPIGVSVDADGNPTYGFDTTLKSTYRDDFSLASRWQMQFGLRYIF